MSSGPDRGQAVGTMGRHMTALSPWCGATARAAARQEKTTQTKVHLSLMFVLYWLFFISKQMEGEMDKCHRVQKVCFISFIPLSLLFYFKITL